jgi:hypothetical protein
MNHWHNQRAGKGGVDLPPEFVPGERRKSREKTRPREPRSVNDIVDDITKKYREEQRTRGLVDNWGQPQQKLDRRKVKEFVKNELEQMQDNSKRMKKRAVGDSLLKAPLESLSEAIGRKFKQKRDSKPRTREISKPHQLSKQRESKKSTPKPRERTKSQNSSTKERKDVQRRSSDGTLKPPKEQNKAGKVYDVKMRFSEIRGVEFRTEGKLRKFMNEELNGMKHLPGFDKMMNDAIAHINLKKSIGDRTSLTFPEIRELSNQIDVPLRTTRKWVADSGNPKLYRLAESAITKSDAKALLDRLKLSRNGVDNVPEIQKRLSNLYSGDHVRQLKSFNRDLEASRKYFKFLELLSDGGIVTDIARRAGVSPLTGRNYTNGVFPHLVKRVVDVPSAVPKDGWKWLQLAIDGNRVAIEAPLKAKDWSDVKDVLQQLGLVGGKMAQLPSKFDIHDKETAFMYALGAIISDGSLSASGLSSRMTLPLSKKYNWSLKFGEAVCLCLGALGIKAEKKSDWKSPNNVITDGGRKRRISGPGFHVWESEQHPLLGWIRKSCLGLNKNQNKIENPLDAEWVLSAPRRLRTALVQGIADGDGYVSVNSQYAALSTKVNQPFFGRLLRSFDIESLETKKDVLIKQTESILKFAELEPFRQAKSRRKDLEELNSLVITRKSKIAGSRLSQAEIDQALMLRRKGKSYGEITKLVYREFGTSWDISTIEHAIKRHTQTKSSQSGKRKGGGRNTPP